MNENCSMEILATLRTLLALERTVFSEERTCLAEFRTGLALALIAPPASTVVSYILSTINVSQDLIFELLNFGFFAVLTILGIWISLKSRLKLNQLKKRKKNLKIRENAIFSNKAYMDKCPAIELIGDFLDQE